MMRGSYHCKTALAAAVLKVTSASEAGWHLQSQVFFLCDGLSGLLCGQAQSSSAAQVQLLS